jgi:hypothetical protein
MNRSIKMSKPKTAEELQKLLEASVRVLQSPANHKNEDRNIKGFVEGLKSALGQYTASEDGITRVDKNLAQMVKGMLEKKEADAALAAEAKKAGISVEELQHRRALAEAQKQHAAARAAQNQE